MLFKVSQSNYFPLSVVQLSLFGSEKWLSEKGGNDLLRLLYSVAQENHTSTYVAENYCHSHGIFEASLCF